VGRAHQRPIFEFESVSHDARNLAGTQLLGLVDTDRLVELWIQPLPDRAHEPGTFSSQKADKLGSDRLQTLAPRARIFHIQSTIDGVEHRAETGEQSDALIASGGRHATLRAASHALEVAGQLVDARVELSDELVALVVNVNVNINVDIARRLGLLISRLLDSIHVRDSLAQMARFALGLLDAAGELLVLSECRLMSGTQLVGFSAKLLHLGEHLIALALELTGDLNGHSATHISPATSVVIGKYHRRHTSNCYRLFVSAGRARSVIRIKTPQS
jgi:hypothetical protein